MSSVLSILILASAYGLHLKGTSISMATGMRLDKYPRAYKLETKVTRRALAGSWSRVRRNCFCQDWYTSLQEEEEDRTVRFIFCVVNSFEVMSICIKHT